MSYLLGIDLGSTSLKAIVYDRSAQLVAAGSRATQRAHPNPAHPEWTVWEPEQIWGGAAAAIRDAVNQLDDPRQIQAVAVTGMGMDGLPVDAEGRWLYPLISWHDPRTGPQHQWWLEHVTAKRTFAIGGNPVWPINSALRILWMMEHEPAIMQRAAKWLLIEDLVNYMLCGRQVTDYSMASCTMLFDQRTCTWSEELLACSGIESRWLCDVQPSGSPLGTVHATAAAATGLAEGTPVVLGGHDHLCGALPVGAFRPGTVLDITGTWECVMTPTPEPILDDRLRQLGMTVQAHVATGLHAVWGGCVAGEMLEWHRRQVAGARDGADLEATAEDWETLMREAAATSPGAGGVLFLPHLSGAACPIVDPRSLGAFAGLSTRTTRGDLTRAVIEGLDYQFLDMVLALESALGTQLDNLIAVGGAIRNTFWMQNKADVTGRVIEVPDVTEASPLGAAMLAGIGCGMYRDLDDALQHVYRRGSQFHPDPARSAQYARWFSVYQDLYPALKPASHRLYEEFST